MQNSTLTQFCSINIKFSMKYATLYQDQQNVQSNDKYDLKIEINEKKKNDNKKERIDVLEQSQVNGLLEDYCTVHP